MPPLGLSRSATVSRNNRVAVLDSSRLVSGQFVGTDATGPAMPPDDDPL